MSRLVVVSNRTATPGAPRSGGLATALHDALAESGGLWFGWSGQTVEASDEKLAHAAEDDYAFALLDLTEADYEGYYLGYSNAALWPVLHYRVDLARFDDEAFAQYDRVNARFARLLAPLMRDDDTVWVHDYHLMLLGRELRAAGWRGPTGFFLHIPFPSPEVFTALPQHAEIAEALAAFDLVGFQTAHDAENFRRYLAEQHAATPLADGVVHAFGTVLRAAAFPIGIDPDSVSAAAADWRSHPDLARLARGIGEDALVVGVDRLDYSKGLPQRLEAFGQLIAADAALHARVSLVQIAPPSRTEVEAYADLREQVDRIAGRINSDHADLGWIPVRYIAREYPRDKLAGLYRLARVGLVTPLRDGMNLVAKEFVAAQDPGDPGVLIVSEPAGAAEQLEEAVQVNPYDIAAVTDALRSALEMPHGERSARWQALRARVWREDVGWWWRGYLDALRATR